MLLFGGDLEVNGPNPTRRVGNTGPLAKLGSGQKVAHNVYLITYRDRAMSTACQSLSWSRRSWQPLLANFGPILTAVLLALCFPPFDLTWLAWIALVPFCWALVESEDVLLLYLGTYLGGEIFYWIGLDFLRTVQVHGEGSVWSWRTGMFGSAWAVQGMALGFCWVVAMWCGRRLLHRCDWPLLITLPIVWIGVEFLRDPVSRMFTGAGFNLLQVGMTQIDRSYLIQIADLGGTYAVTYVVVTVNSLGYLFLQWFVTKLPEQSSRSQFRRAVLATGVLLAATCAYGAWRLLQPLGENGPIVAIVSDDLRLGSLDQSVTELRNRLREIPRPHAAEVGLEDEGSIRADLMMWSELAYDKAVVLPPARASELADSSLDVNRAAATWHVNDLHTRPLRMLEELSSGLQASLIVGCRRFEHGPDGSRRFNSVVYLTPAEGLRGVYDKTFLAPIVEYLPPAWVTSLFYGLDRVGQRDEYFERGQSPSVFKVRFQNSQREAYFGVSICFDSCHPELYRHMVSGPGRGASAEFFLVSTHEMDDASLRFQAMHLTMARFRAVECRRAFCRSSMLGYSAIIDGNGRILTHNPDPKDVDTIVVGVVPLDTRGSLYVLIGDWLPILACGLVGVGIVWPICRGWPRDLPPSRTQAAKAGAGRAHHEPGNGFHHRRNAGKTAADAPGR